MKRILTGLVVVIASVGIASAQGGKHPLSIDDYGKIKDVRDPQCAPDGKTVAFVVSQIDVLATVARLAGLGGACSMVAESVFVSNRFEIRLVQKGVRR